MAKPKEQDHIARLLEETGELYIDGRLVKAETKDEETADVVEEEGENG